MVAQTQQSGTATKTRFDALREAFRCAVGAAYAELSPEEFVSHFPTLTEQQRDAVFDAYRQVLHVARTNSEAEFEDIVEESQLWTKLDSLEQLCAAQGLDEHGGISQTNSGVKPSESPSAVAARCKAQAQATERQLLMKQLETLEREQLEARAALETKRKQVVASASHIQSLGNWLQGFQPAAEQWAGRSVDPLTPV